MKKQMSSVLKQGDNTPVVLVGGKENEILSEEQAVSRLGIDGLTIESLHRWFRLHGFCKIARPPYEKRRMFQPTQKFFEYVKLKGYFFDDMSNERIEFVYSSNLVERLIKEHKQEIIDFVDFIKREKTIQEKVLQEQSYEENTWEEFINLILNEKQVQVLKYALKIDARIHFYGYGLGKSTVADLLFNLGFNVTAPYQPIYEDLQDVGYVPYIPDGEEAICFNVKKTTANRLIPFYYILKDRQEEILDWVSS